MGDRWATRTDKETDDSMNIAIEWFLDALKQHRSARVLTFLGATYRELDAIEQARAAFEEAIKIDSSYEEAFYNLGVLEEHTNPLRAVELLDRATQIDPRYSAAHQELGKLYQRSDDFPRAEYHFRRCTEIDPNDYWSQIYLANLLGVQGRTDEAESIYRFAIDLHPEISSGLELFARFLDSIGKAEEGTKVRARINQSK